MSETETRQRLAAILMADVAGYSRLMSCDERGTVAALDDARAVFRTTIDAHRGRVIDMAGDSVLAVFETASGAVVSALAIQAELGPALGRRRRRLPHAVSHRHPPRRRHREGRRHGLRRRRQHRRAPRRASPSRAA